MYQDHVRRAAASLQQQERDASAQVDSCTSHSQSTALDLRLASLTAALVTRLRRCSAIAARRCEGGRRVCTRSRALGLLLKAICSRHRLLQLYAECRVWMETTADTRPASVQPTTSAPVLSAACTQQELADLVVEKAALQTRCTLLTTELQDAQAQIQQLAHTNKTQRALVTKYEQSALDGTDTIEHLQDSLVKLCEQITHERLEHERALRHATERAHEHASKLQERLAQLQTRVDEFESRTEAAVVANVLERLETARRAQSEEHASVSRDEGRASHAADASKTSRCASTEDVESETSRMPAARIDRAAEPMDDIEDIDDVDGVSDDDVVQPDDALSHGARGPVAAAAQRVDARKAPGATCRSCGEEPFGFMVKCQKCKDPFHAGCVKPPDGKRRISHVFTCSSCALQRPSKASRLEPTPSSARSKHTPAATARRPLV